MDRGNVDKRKAMLLAAEHGFMLGVAAAVAAYQFYKDGARFQPSPDIEVDFSANGNGDTSTEESADLPADEPVEEPADSPPDPAPGFGE